MYNLRYVLHPVACSKQVIQTPMPTFKTVLDIQQQAQLVLLRFTNSIGAEEQL